MRPIHLARLDKTRPVLILTRTLAIERLRAVVVASITSTVRGFGTEVLLGPANGLDHSCVVNLDHIVSIDPARLGRRIGLLLQAQEELLHDALLHTFDLDCPR